MANEPFRKNQGALRGKSMSQSTLGASPAGAVKTPNTGGLADKLAGSLGYKKGGHKGFPMPNPGVHSMAGHTGGVGSPVGPLGGFGVSRPRFGSFSGGAGPTAPGAGVPRFGGGMVGSSGGGDNSIHAPRTMPARPSAPLLPRKTSPFQR